MIKRFYTLLPVNLNPDFFFFFKFSPSCNEEQRLPVFVCLNPDFTLSLPYSRPQCFCFEEQRLRGNEEVDMPVFFYLDPEFATDWNCRNVEDITLSYTFHKVWTQSVTQRHKSGGRDSSGEENPFYGRAGEEDVSGALASVRHRARHVGRAVCLLI